MKDKILKFLYQSNNNKIKKFISLNSFENNFNNILIPILNDFNDNNNKIIIGISGTQGSGKSTLSNILTEIFNNVYKKNCINISLDDFYFTYEERLKKNIKFRGPPGTHDINFWEKVLDNFLNSKELSIPIFNKNLFNGQGDREKNLIKIDNNIDIWILEGWFVGIYNIEENYFNKNLKNYEYIWDKISSLYFLIPNDFNYVYKWRMNQEIEFNQGMSSNQIKEFVDHFNKELPFEVFYKNLKNKKSINKFKKIFNLDINHFVQN